MIKRFFDYIFALNAVHISLPIIIAIAALIRFNFGSLIFFTQSRPGLNGKVFKLPMYRSMLDVN